MYNLSIGKRTFVVVFCITMILFSMLFLVSDLMYISSYRELENRNVVQNVARIADILASKQDELNSLCNHWASWDETYQFAETLNPDYTQRNLGNVSSFSSININLFLVVNPAGQVIFNKAVNQTYTNQIALPEDFLANISKSLLISNGNNQARTSGIMLLSGSPLLVAAEPILTSSAQGPAAGTLIMGYFLGAQTISSISKTTGLSLTMLAPDYNGFPPAVQTVLKSPDGNNTTVVHIIDNNSITGYQTFDDIYGRPAFVFRVEMPRQIYAEGQKTLTYLHISLLLMSIGFFFIFVFIVNKTILNRMTTLSNSVNSIGVGGNVSQRVFIPGKDELSGLADNINVMLESIEKSSTEIRSQKEFIDSILATIPNAVLAIDKSQNIKLANSAFNTMFGVEAGSLKGKTINSITVLNDLSYEAAKFIHGNNPEYRTEFQITGNGFRKTFTVSFSRMQEEDLFLLIFTDITITMDRQDRLYLTDRLASVGQMASGIAHELNNPLASIVGLSELLTEEELPESVREDVKIINSEGLRAAGVVKNMLSFARTHTPTKQPVQMNQVIEDILKLRAYHWRVNNITVETNLDQELPNIMADYFQMQQVFLNIVLNAEHSMSESHGKGLLKITSKLVDDMVIFSFSDDGTGIAPQNISRIFDPFFTTKEVGSGTGLGLSICYGIVTSHGGRINARSEIGQGATFVVELPAN
jgi:PAS domain S-box-containing protein